MAKRKIKKRSRAMASVIGVVCVALIGFVMVWAGYKAIKGFEDSSVDTASAADISAASAGDSSVPAESKAEDKSSTDDAKPDESNADASSQADDTQSDVSSAPDNSQEENSYWTESVENAGKTESKSSGEIVFPTSAEIDDDFADAVFIGNSRTVGLQLSCGKPQATFYASTGMNVNKIWDAKEITLDDGTEGTVFDALKQHQFKRVFVMFGINEMGWPYLDVFREMYEKAINEIKRLQPDATVYIQSVLPVSTKAISTNEVFTTANVDAFNEYVKTAAANTGCVYLDVNSALRDETGGLPLEASTDGIHLMKDYCLVWLKYLADHT